MCSIYRQLALVMGTLVAFSFPSFAQGSSAAVSGLVKDPAGLVIVGAKILATNVDTGVTYPTETTGSGLYNLRNLPPAKYRIAVSMEGFESMVREDIQLHVAEVVAIDFQLRVGSVTTSITVSGDAPLVNTQTSSLGGLVEQNQLYTLPLAGRNYIGLTLMQPGVVNVPYQRRDSGGTAGTWFSANGASVRSNNFMLDTALLQNLFAGSTSTFSGTTLGLDGISEYRVLTNSYSAEYGMSAGGQTVMVSKSGSNEYHGSVFEYLRNDALDAANYFDTPAGSGGHRLPPFRRNNFGVSFGGPIIKEKTFFFAVYEGLRERKGITTITNTLGAGCHGPAGATITNTACPQLGSTASVTIDSVVAPLVEQYTLPNLPNNRLTFPYSQPTSVNYGQIRVDQNFSDKDKMFARYTIDDSETVGSMPFPQFLAPLESRNQFFTVGEDHVFSEYAVNTFRFSVSRTKAIRGNPSDLVGPEYSFMPGQPIPAITVSGLSAFGPVRGGLDAIQNILTFSDDFSYSSGRHMLKVGTQINRWRQDMVSRSNLNGSLAFGNVADFLRGRVNNYSAVTSLTDDPMRYVGFYTLGFYVQDDWRLRSNFTLNAGLRYEYRTDYKERNHMESCLINPYTDASFTPGLLFQNPTLHNFSPRIGFAWDVMGNGKTAVRGGGGILYDIANQGIALLSTWNNLPPFTGTSQMTSTPSNPLTLTIPLYFPPESRSRNGNQTFEWNLKQPKLYTWNLTVEQLLPFSMAVAVTYAGSRGTQLYSTYEGNYNAAEFTADGQPFWPSDTSTINPYWGSVVTMGSRGDSNYNALQLRVLKRMAKGLQFQTSYTWAKTIDDTQSMATGDSTTTPSFMANPYDTRYDRALSALHIAHVLVVNALYEFPSPKVENKILSTLAAGWGMSGILTAQTGTPFTIQIATNRSRSGVNGGGRGNSGGIDRPDVNPAFSGTLILGDPSKYYDPNAFILQPVGTLGNVGRNSVIGPGLTNLDFAVRKNTGLKFLGEAGNLEFRVEAFNLFNHPNFAIPNNVVFTGSLANATEKPLATAGQITRTATESRQLQISLRIAW